MIETWSSVLRASFQDIWFGVASFLPNLVAAIVIFIVGWVIGRLVGKVVAQVIRSVKVDSVLRSIKFDEVLKRGGFNLDSGAFVGALVEWFIIIAFLVASLDALGLNQVNVFLQQVLAYLPQVITAVLILIVGVMVAEAMRKVVIGSSQAAGIKSASFLGAVTRWSIWIFAILTALYQLGIAAQFIQILFTGVVVALAIAFGLAFGLGGQGTANEVLDKVKREITEHHIG